MRSLGKSLLHLSIIICISVFTYGAPLLQLCGKCHYVQWAQDAVCTNLGLKEPPNECCEAKTLSLSNNNITVLNKNAFFNFSNLYQVDIDNNHLEYIDQNAFVGNNKVTYIYLNDNLLTNVANRTFTGVPKLKELYLNKNKISGLEVLAFQDLSELSLLHISYNNVRGITRGILSYLKQLKYLYMANNYLKLLQSETFADLVNVRHMELSYNKIAIIEGGAFQGLVRLRVLNLAQNNIVSIGSNALLPTHHQLDLLNISGNCMTTLSNISQIFQVLNKFYLEDNPLVCNTGLKPAISWYQKHNSPGTSDDPVCDEPECLKGHKVKYLVSEENFCDSLVTQHVTSEVEQPAQEEENPKEEEQSKLKPQVIFVIVLVIVVCIIGFLVFLVKMGIPAILNRIS